MIHRIVLIDIGDGMALNGVLPSVVQGDAYSAFVRARGGTAPYTYTLTAGEPALTAAGISLDRNTGEVLASSVLTAGNLPLTIRATDITGAWVERSFVIAVVAEAAQGWVSMFDVGPCTVSFDAGYDAVWSGLLAKGESSDLMPYDYYGSDATIHAEVSDSGVLSLVMNYDGEDYAPPSLQGTSLRVEPNYEISDKERTRMREIGTTMGLGYPIPAIASCGNEGGYDDRGGWWVMEDDQEVSAEDDQEVSAEVLCDAESGDAIPDTVTFVGYGGWAHYLDMTFLQGA